MSVNKVILVGNVGKDPEVRYVESNVAVANFPLATSERGYTSRSGAQIPERTEWHNIVLWRGLAEVAEKYVKKGTQLYIEGKLRTRSWTDNNNVVRYTTEIFADNMEILSRRDSGSTQQAQQTAEAAPVVEEDSDALPF
ncbi:MAG: single-stranded DNA-binding protein [Muribaculaceae bacterium]|nr:single-stranded DNA-binding protein [Muribaculaceae bacterium]